MDTKVYDRSEMDQQQPCKVGISGIEADPIGK